MSLFPNGPYKLFNARFPDQGADLLDGQSTSSIAGHDDKYNSLNIVVRLCVIALLFQHSLNGWVHFYSGT